MQEAMKPKLLVAPCDYKAAKYAVEHWHYSKSMPAAPIAWGVWENSRFVGAILFARGAAMNIGSPYGLPQTSVCELVRVALSKHQTPTSQIVAIAIKCLKKQSPGIRLLVSYADTKEGHHGGIYQAMNWIYEGSKENQFQFVNGELTHRKTVFSRYGRQDIAWLRENIDPNAEWVKMPPKHKYLYPLDKAMREQIALLAKPYPKRESANG